MNSTLKSDQAQGHDGIGTIDYTVVDSMTSENPELNLQMHFVLMVLAIGRILRALDQLFAPLPIGDQYALMRWWR